MFLTIQSLKFFLVGDSLFQLGREYSHKFSTKRLLPKAFFLFSPRFSHNLREFEFDCFRCQTETY